MSKNIETLRKQDAKRTKILILMAGIAIGMAISNTIFLLYQVKGG